MRYSIAILWGLISTNLALAQLPEIQWQRSYGGLTEDAARSVRPTSDGGYIMVGYTTSGSGQVTGFHGGDDVWVVKTDAVGVLQWQKALGGSGSDRGNAIEQTADGGYIIAASTNSNDGDVSGSHGFTDAWVIKLDATGNLEWDRVLGSSGFDGGRDVIELEEGGFLIAGEAGASDGDVSGTHGNTDLWVIRLADDGALVWERCYGSSGYDPALNMARANDGNFMIVGSAAAADGNVSATHGAGDYWVIKIDGDAELVWEKCFGGSSFDQAYVVHPTNDGGCIIGGGSSSFDGDVTGNHGGFFDCWVIKLDPDGELEWENALGGSSIDGCNGVIQTSDGGYAVVGTTSSVDGDVSTNHGDSDAWLVKLDATGEMQWETTLGGTGFDGANGIVPTSDGGCAIAGVSNSTDGDVTGNHGGYDYWLVKLGSDPSAVLESAQTIWSVFPNPTAGSLTLSLTAPAHSTRVQVNDAAGRTVLDRLLIDASGPITLSVDHLAAGVYQLVIVADGKVGTQQVIKY